MAMEQPDLLEDKIDDYAELALGRSNFYFFLSSVFLKPPTTDIIKMLTELTNSPAFSSFESKQTADFLSRMGIINNEALKNLVHEYHDLFKVPLSKYVAPYESVYRDGHLNGQSAIDVKKIYHRLGFQIPREYHELPDYIGIELAFMAILCKEEHKAWKEKNVKLARSLWEIEEKFLNEHITCWLSKLCNTICEKTKDNFYICMAGFVCYHDWTGMPGFVVYGSFRG
jgi:TorA maturation chaperone TorD